MRRVLAILKYVPAVLCGLLVVAWVVSFCVRVEWRSEHFCCEIFRSGLFVDVGSAQDGPFAIELERTKFPFDTHTLLGDNFRGFWFFGTDEWDCGGEVPFSMLVTLLAPLGMAPFIRFPLWSYFAWTALLAAELAYYLK